MQRRATAKEHSRNGTGNSSLPHQGIHTMYRSPSYPVSPPPTNTPHWEPSDAVRLEQYFHTAVQKATKFRIIVKCGLGFSPPCLKERAGILRHVQSPLSFFCTWSRGLFVCLGEGGVAYWGLLPSTVVTPPGSSDCTLLAYIISVPCFSKERRIYSFPPSVLPLLPHFPSPPCLLHLITSLIPLQSREGENSHMRTLGNLAWQN